VVLRRAAAAPRPRRRRFDPDLGAAALLGEGDGFDAADLACAEDRCVLLTTRQARVAIPGAEVRIGASSQPATAWRRVEIPPPEGTTDAFPSSIARVEAPTSVTLVEGVDLAFYEIGDGPSASPTGRIPAPHGVIDAIAAPAPMALIYGAELDGQGCALGGVNLGLGRPAAETVPLETPAPPLTAYLRRLGRGVLAAWMSPLGCGASRRVVYAAVIAPDGTPGAIMAVGDAASFGVASRGDDVDLWIQEPAGPVSWVRATCAAP
jgi:hypothetical protein